MERRQASKFYPHFNQEESVWEKTKSQIMKKER